MIKPTELKIDAIRPRISNTAETASAHAWNANHQWKRPRILAVGPEPVAAPGENQDEFGGVIRWPHVDGDNTSYVHMCNTWLPTTGVDSRIEARCEIAAVHLTDQASHLTRDLDWLSSHKTTADWQVEFGAEQLTDGDADWSAATSLATDFRDPVSFEHWPTSTSGTFWFLQQQAWTKFEPASGSTYAQVFKEGQLHESDFGFFETLSLSVSLSSQDLDLPVNFYLKARRDAADTPIYGGATNEQHDAAEYLRLALVSITFVEYPI